MCKQSGNKTKLQRKSAEPEQINLSQEEILKEILLALAGVCNLCAVDVLLRETHRAVWETLGKEMLIRANDIKPHKPDCYCFECKFCIRNGFDGLLCLQDGEVVDVMLSCDKGERNTK